MNANELADELVDLIVAPTPVDDKWACELIDQAVIMLRQQADRIAELEEENDSYLMRYSEQFEEWYDCVIWGNSDFKECCEKAWEAGIKSCTPQTKPLNDEEIMEIVADKYEKGHGRYIDTKLFFVEFAKAILRKAQEK